MKQDVQQESQFETVGKNQGERWMRGLLLCLLHVGIPIILADGTAGAKGFLVEKSLFAEKIDELEDLLGF